jgi:hypothetical protein
MLIDYVVVFLTVNVTFKQIVKLTINVLNSGDMQNFALTPNAYASNRLLEVYLEAGCLISTPSCLWFNHPAST